jgi:hypothetical protein
MSIIDATIKLIKTCKSIAFNEVEFNNLKKELIEINYVDLKDQHLQNAKLVFLKGINELILAMGKGKGLGSASEKYTWSRSFYFRATKMVLNIDFENEELLKKRDWCYAQHPVSYSVCCDECDGNNTTWSEFEKHIWCYDCEIDTKGTAGIFDSPIPINTAKLMGISFDRISIPEGKLLVMSIGDDGEIVYNK